jgi:hypothetical protein
MKMKFEARHLFIKLCAQFVWRFIYKFQATWPQGTDSNKHTTCSTCTSLLKKALQIMRKLYAPVKLCTERWNNEVRRCLRAAAAASHTYFISKRKFAY